jgi:hypothetical protein
MGIIHFILMMGTLALTYEYYDNLAYEIPKIVHTIVYVGVIGVSVVWALAHALFGAAMGIAAGGVMDGIRMGLMLGVGMSIGRLWVYVLTFSAGAFLCHAETWVIVASALVGFICLAINNLVKFFWGNTSSGI